MADKKQPTLFTKQYEQFKFEFDLEWSNMWLEERGEVNNSFFLEVNDGDSYSVLPLDIEQVREIQKIINEQVEAYETWAAANDQKETN